LNKEEDIDSYPKPANIANINKRNLRNAINITVPEDAVLTPDKDNVHSNGIMIKKPLQSIGGDNNVDIIQEEQEQEFEEKKHPKSGNSLSVESNVSLPSNESINDEQQITPSVNSVPLQQMSKVQIILNPHCLKYRQMINKSFLLYL